jgi:hypothetical protein
MPASDVPPGWHPAGPDVAEGVLIRDLGGGLAVEVVPRPGGTWDWRAYHLSGDADSGVGGEGLPSRAAAIAYASTWIADIGAVEADTEITVAYLSCGCVVWTALGATYAASECWRCGQSGVSTIYVEHVTVQRP